QGLLRRDADEPEHAQRAGCARAGDADLAAAHRPDRRRGEARAASVGEGGEAMPDQFTEVTSQGWFSRLGDSLKGMIGGFIMFIVAFPLLFWNEGRAVRTYKSQQEGAKAVVSLSADKIDPRYEGRLIHVNGTPVADETLTDDQMGVTSKGMVL